MNMVKLAESILTAPYPVKEASFEELNAELHKIIDRQKEEIEFLQNQILERDETINRLERLSEFS